MRQADDADDHAFPRAADAAARVVGVLQGQPDPAIRVAWLQSTGLPAESAALAGFLEALAEGADASLAGYRHALHEVSVALAPSSSVERRRAAAAGAIAGGFLKARELLVPEVRERREKRGSTQEPVLDRSVTLGERKSYARRPERVWLEKMIRDPNPDVVRILLGNPKLREQDVLRWASRRPIEEAVLREIYVHPRWFTRYAVRFSLVQNPWLPSDLGCALVRTLLAQDAAVVAQALELPEPVRRLAERAPVPVH